MAQAVRRKENVPSIFLFGLLLELVVALMLQVSKVQISLYFHTILKKKSMVLRSYPFCRDQ